MPEYVADVSEFQGVIDFDAYKNAGFDAIIIRAGFGTSREDNYFRRNWSEAKRVGLRRVAYWFNYPGYNTPQDEAARFNQVVGPLANDGTEGLMGDFENEPLGTGVRPWPSDGYAWASAFLNGAGPADYPPFWYASPSFVIGHRLEPLYPTWKFAVANYGVSSPAQPVPANLWQFTSRATVAGISGPCDLSVVLRGTFADLLYGGGEMPLTQADLDAIEVVVSKQNVPVREDITQIRDEIIAAIQSAPANVDAKAILDELAKRLQPPSTPTPA